MYINNPSRDIIMCVRREIKKIRRYTYLCVRVAGARLQPWCGASESEIHAKSFNMPRPRVMFIILYKYNKWTKKSSRDGTEWFVLYNPLYMQRSSRFPVHRPNQTYRLIVKKKSQICSNVSCILIDKKWFKYIDVKYEFRHWWWFAAILTPRCPFQPTTEDYTRLVQLL